MGIPAEVNGRSRSPAPSAALVAKPALYVTLPKRDLHQTLGAKMELCGQAARARHGVTIETYLLYCVTEPRNAAGKEL